MLSSGYATKEETIEGQEFNQQSSQINHLQNWYFPFPSLALDITIIWYGLIPEYVVSHNVTEWDIRSWYWWLGFHLNDFFRPTISIQWENIEYKCVNSVDSAFTNVMSIAMPDCLSSLWVHSIRVGRLLEFFFLATSEVISGQVPLHSAHSWWFYRAAPLGGPGHQPDILLSHIIVTLNQPVIYK